MKLLAVRSMAPGSTSMRIRPGERANGGTTGTKRWTSLLRQRAIGVGIRFTQPAIVFAACAPLSAVRPQVPVYEVTSVESSIQFDVQASVAIKGTSSKWDASMIFESADVRTGTLAIKIQGHSVDTGSGMKNNKLKGKDFFDVANASQITFVFD